MNGPWFRLERWRVPLTTVWGNRTGQHAHRYRLFVGPVVVEFAWWEYPSRWEAHNTETRED